MLVRLEKNERFNRDDLVKVIKETKDEDKEYTQAKIEIY